MSEASKALAEVRGWLCDNLNASGAGHVCGMLSVVSRRVVQADELESENAKLRKLAREMYPQAKAHLQLGVTLGFNDTLSYDWALQMTELGIEVPE